jgi:hypothetical protein
MADPQPPTGSAAPPKMPLWVKVFGIVLIVLALMIGIMIISGGEHGPGRHIPSGEHSTEHP